MHHRRREFSAQTRRDAFARSGGICECHRIPSLNRPQGCMVKLIDGATFYEHIRTSWHSHDNSLDNCAALTRTALDRHGDVSLMRGAFEQMLRRLVPVRMVRLREASSRWGIRPEGRAGTESITLDVPVPDAVPKSVLEATFDPASGLGEWDFQMLALAAQIAALKKQLAEMRKTLQSLEAALQMAAPEQKDPEPKQQDSSKED